MTENKFQIDHKNDYEIKMTIIKDLLEKPPVTMILHDKYGWSNGKDYGNWLLQALICSGDSVVASLTKSYKSFLLNLPQ